LGAGEERDKYNSQAKEDDARQYGVWGVDGIRQRSASFAKMEEDWEETVRPGLENNIAPMRDTRHARSEHAQVPKRNDRFWKREWFHDPSRDGTRMGYHADGIRQRSASFAMMEDHWEGAVSQVWISTGATEVATQRLLILGAKWQKGALGEIYRDPEAVSLLVRSLRQLLPGANPAAVFHGCPAAALVCVDRNALSQQLVALRTGVGVSRFDLARVITHSPSLLLMADARVRCGASADALRGTFLGVLLGEEGVAAAIEVCPSLLEAPAEDVAGAFEGFRDDCWEKVRDAGGSALSHSLDILDTGPGGAIGRMTEGEGKDEAKEVGMRHAVDYAGRVAEPYLKRAKVEREKSVGRLR